MCPVTIAAVAACRVQRDVPALISSDCCWNTTSGGLPHIIQVPICRVIPGSSMEGTEQAGVTQNALP